MDAQQTQHPYRSPVVPVFAVVVFAAAAAAAQAEDTATDAETMDPIARAYADSDGAGTIRIRGEAEAKGPKIHLEDIAELEGEGAEALGAIIVGRFDQQQRELTLRGREVRQALAAYRLNWARLNLSGHSRCKVERTGPLPEPEQSPQAGASERRGLEDGGVATADASEAEPIEPAALEAPRTVRQQIERILVAMADFEPSQMLISYPDDADDLLNRPLAGGHYQIEPLTQGLPGRVIVKVRRDRPGGRSQVEQLRLMVSRRVNAVVLRNAVMRGQELSPADIELKQVVLTGDVGKPLMRAEDAVGQTVVSSLRSGAVLYETQLRPPRLIRRQDQVVVESVSGGVSVLVRGRALSDGRRGDRIRVRRHGSNEVLHAVVKGEGHAVIR